MVVTLSSIEHRRLDHHLDAVRQEPGHDLVAHAAGGPDVVAAGAMARLAAKNTVAGRCLDHTQIYQPASQVISESGSLCD